MTTEEQQANCDSIHDLIPESLEINTMIVSIAHPDWGKWRVTKIPTKREDWYHIRGESGEHMEDEYELRRFWKVVE